jgi:hypothetical protein
VPVCDHWDNRESKPLPPAPYLLQGMKHPSPIGIQTIRKPIRVLSVKSGLESADGSGLVVAPHDCRRVFASEHLNNDTPVARDPGSSGACHAGHSRGVREAVSSKNDRGISQSDSWYVRSVPWGREFQKAHSPRVGGLPRQLQHTRYGNASLCASYRGSLSARARLPGMQSGTTKEERGSPLSKTFSQVSKLNLANR